MKGKALLRKILKITGLTVGAVIVLCVLAVGLLYTPWVQNYARKIVIEKLSTGNTHVALEKFRLRFPLKVNLEGLSFVTSGDTVIAARSLEASVALMPLLKGTAEISDVEARGARYVIGTPDSLMYMTVDADSIGINPASVGLSDMAIRLENAAISGGRVGIYLKPDTSTAAKPATPPTKMSIELGRVALNDFDYAMRLMPSIDTLSAHITRSELLGGRIDLEAQTIKLGRFTGSGLAARYIAPDSAAIAAGGPYPDAAETAAQAADSVAPWTVEIDTIAFNKSKALYATAGVVPVPGLDFSYISVDSLDLFIHNFYNQQTTVKLPVSIKGRERCGVVLDVIGQLDIDATALTFNGTNLKTANGTDVNFSGKLGMGDMATDPTLPLKLWLKGNFDPADLGLMFPAFSAYLAPIPSADDIQLTADVDGTTGHLDIADLALQLNGCVNLDASGYVENFMDPSKIGGNLKLKGNIINVNSFKNSLLDRETAKSLRIPPMTLAGNVDMHSGVVKGNLAAATGKGRIKLDASWNGTAESYRANLATNSFPVQAFMPLLGVGAVTATANVEGHGYDPFSKRTAIDATLGISRAEYGGTTYTDISGKAQLKDGQATVNLVSTNPDAELTVDASGNLDGNVYTWTADVDGANIDLFALKLSPDPTSLEVRAHADATIGPGMNNIKGQVRVNDFFYRAATGTIGVSDVDAQILTADSLTNLVITNRDLTAAFTSPVNPQLLMSRLGEASTIAAGQIRDFMVNVDTLGKALPPFLLDVSAGHSNLVNDILAPSKMAIRSLHLSASNDSILSIAGNVRQFRTETMVIDSIFLAGRQHGKHMHLNAGMQNRPGNMDEWHKVNMKSVVDDNKMQLALHQENLKGKTGFDIGMLLTANAADSTLVLNIKPYTPTIGYQPWTANEDNFISYCLPTRHIDANLRMHGDNSSLAIFTQHPEGVDHDHEGAVQEDLIVQLSDIHVQDWISFNPFAPPVKGDINADLRLNLAGDRIVGQGDAGISNFYYGREKVSDIKAEFNALATPSGTINATAAVYVDGRQTMTLSGALNDSTATSPLAMDFSMIRFPLATANPFLPPTVGRLRGVLNGTMKVSGATDKPILNGWLDFDSTAVKLAITGTEYTFSPEKIPVENSVVTFTDFAINGCNSNPLLINGNVDVADMANMKMNLNLKADNMQIVKSNRASKGADVYGRAFISLDANAHGSMELLSVNANLHLLPETNVTYVIPETSSLIADQGTSDMVKFVNFTDSVAVAQADSLSRSTMSMFLDASVTIEEGSTITVNLPGGGNDRVQVQSNGTLQYSMTPMDADGNLIGRLNINKGFVQYTPPLISEKVFNFKEGSYVAFSGNMMNPTLNIQAVDVMKANVTQEGQNSRLVNFDVSLSVTGTLERMNVAFDLATNDDITVANELESMSAEQRANQAMNMLLYNVYTGPGTKANAALSGNPLFSFLESKINNWAASNIKGVDLSFGIDQYDRTMNGSTSSTMSYSYQVSKSLFNDRFKIVVGGNYSTDANADENFSQNLINDISFEYFLNANRTMYVRLFRHTGYESILEGEITQTGVGFVYRRKLQRVSDMFIPQKRVKARQKAELEKLEEEYRRTHPEKTEEK